MASEFFCVFQKKAPVISRRHNAGMAAVVRSGEAHDGLQPHTARHVQIFLPARTHARFPHSRRTIVSIL